MFMMWLFVDVAGVVVYKAYRTFDVGPMLSLLPVSRVVVPLHERHYDCYGCCVIAASWNTGDSFFRLFGYLCSSIHLSLLPQLHKTVEICVELDHYARAHCA